MLRALTGAAIGAGVGYLVGCATEENCDRNTNWALGGWDEICISRKVTTVIGLGVGLVLGAATAKRSKSYQGEILSLRTISVVPAPALPGPGRAGFAFSVVVRR